MYKAKLPSDSLTINSIYGTYTFKNGELTNNEMICKLFPRYFEKIQKITEIPLEEINKPHDIINVSVQNTESDNHKERKVKTNDKTQNNCA